MGYLYGPLTGELVESGAEVELGPPRVVPAGEERLGRRPGVSAWSTSSTGSSSSSACGHGSLVLALARAFEALLGPDGSRWPRIHAVQAAAYPAVRRAWSAGAGEVAPTGGGPRLAEGVACRSPVRGRAVLAAIRRSPGTVTEVADAAIVDAFRRTARAGICVEPTSACAVAGCRRLIAGGRIDEESSTVVVITGSGLEAGSDLGRLAGRRREP